MAPEPDTAVTAALAHHRAGRLDQAVAGYEAVLARDPANAVALHLLGMASHQRGDHTRAAELVRRALASDADNATYHANLGTILTTLARHDEAERALRRAIEIDPEQVEAQFNLGNLLNAARRPAEAEAAYRAAIASRPRLHQALNNLGALLRGQGRLDEAEALLRRALKAKPDFARAEYNLGKVLFDQGKLAAAEASFRRILARRPDALDALRNLGHVLRVQNRLSEAADCFRRVLRLQPESTETLADLAWVAQLLCDWCELPACMERLLTAARARMKSDQPAGVAPYLTLTWPPELQHWVARSHVRNELGAFLEAPIHRRRAAPRPSGERLRIGYLSADFKSHATMHLMGGLFARHDRSRFAITAYSIGDDDGSDYRRRVERDCERFVDLAAIPARAAARRIAEDGIDILVDLKGYTRQSRPQIPALRPAPVQASWLGYAGTMGGDFIDWLITDRVVTPPEHKPFYSERFVYLPHCYQVNDCDQPIAAATPTRAACGLPDNALVFCNFNKAFKIELAIFESWMRILRSLPDGVLWLLGDHIEVEDNLRREAAARGIAADRLVFAKRVPKDQHLARHRLADLFLDTRPVNAHTTASDALWAGLPLITCPGEVFVSRVAASLLHALGLPELIASDLAAYEELAIRLGRNAPARQALREKLARHRLSTPLFDTTRFARGLERAYLAIWDAYQRDDSRPIIEIEP